MLCRHAHEDTESGINLFFSYLRCDTARGYTGNPREIGGSIFKSQYRSKKVKKKNCYQF